MEVIAWIIIAALFVTSFAGLIFPIIPSVLLVWGGFLIYQFGVQSGDLSVIFWLAMVVFTVLIIVADILANSYFVKRYGGSKWGERIAAVAVIVGSFVYPPFGILIVPFAAVFVTEMLIQKDAKKALLVSFATFIGFLSGTFAKFIIQVIMIGWFLIEVIF
ncbi:DUF456 domain-containing protein [Bacillus thermotolerans]|uniref:DUF456 domain-containing protein n=1 Tax=Bacillus thermotolerans TaxID=1221996 RepID=A0A0F5HLZ8_BACTR|nr:DUF456 domain-containing protein [Bacillus thermotolerans]KKB33862.1 hypothetical protein QY97_02943 [Bacillus thermotolerans]KKB36737.1 hypothetical protein QY95_03005 [Bacillus thermotolerans]KKB44768.1 hypothetical protein QY96_01049 [Bacillus thermotolerans]